MLKSKRDLLTMLADRLGGEHGRQLRAAVQRVGPIDDLLDRPLSDRDFALQLARLERDFRAALANGKPLDWEKPESWGDLN